MRLFSGFSGVLVFSHHTAVEYHGVLLRITCKRTVHYFLLDDSWGRRVSVSMYRAAQYFFCWMVIAYCIMCWLWLGTRYFSFPPLLPLGYHVMSAKTRSASTERSHPVIWGNGTGAIRANERAHKCDEDDATTIYHSPSSIKTVHFLRVSAVSRVMGPSVLHLTLA